MVIVARGASRNVRIVRMYPLTVLFTFTMVIIINCILGLTSMKLIQRRPLITKTKKAKTEEKEKENHTTKYRLKARSVLRLTISAGYSI